ncbi:hypothetical protein GIB67_014141 [Kingdonia uniflora]|uniref:MYB transcription factor n=1 Tax=Kingdonia uniflora TaxID=39325 RepID=A0A7J7N413_9MAGN|nr:hypothetical protein GIB67_014141 [Kingdonia uniflora]
METAAEKEDKIIVDIQAIHGNDWSLISSMLKGRPTRDVKDRFDILMSTQRWKKRGWPSLSSGKMSKDFRHKIKV